MSHAYNLEFEGQYLNEKSKENFKKWGGNTDLYVHKI